MTEPIVQFVFSAQMMPPEKQARMDGDTFWMMLDQGLHTFRTEKIRLYRHSAPELKEPGGEEARRIAHERLSLAKRITVQTFRMTHDRWEGEIWVDGENFGEWLVKQGAARGRIGVLNGEEENTEVDD